MTDSVDSRKVVYGVGEKDQGLRLDLFLGERIPRMSRQGIKTAISTRVSVTGRGRIKPSTLLRLGDEVIVVWPRAENLPLAMLPSGEPMVPVLYEDPEIIVVAKPASLRMHATASSTGPSLLGDARARWGEEIRLVHRLDRETSGIVVLARTRDAARSLSDAFASGEVKKRYLAVVFGEMEADEGLIDLALGPAEGSAVHIKQGVRERDGRKAVSGYKVLARGGGFSQVEVTPRTGRRHQIRVHLAAIGHPLVGDKLYGARESHHLRFLERGFDEKMRREILTERQLLHAAWIRFPHPDRQEPFEIESPLPADMRDFVAGFRV
jgi:23S rRNA pseudouridine1911/1915/1917 synthase